MFKLQFHRHKISSIFGEKWTTFGVNFCTDVQTKAKTKNIEKEDFSQKNTRQKLVKKQEDKNAYNNT